MNIVIKIICNALPAALDFCVGAFISVFLFRYFEREPSFTTPLIGGFLALLPDMDFPTQFIPKKGEVRDHHTSPLHYPLLMIPIVAYITFTIGGTVWLVIGLTALAFHYVHDMIGPYSGIFLFWPLSRRFYGTNGIEDKKTSERWLFLKNYGHDFWIANYWVRPKLSSLSELVAATLFSIATCVYDSQFYWLLILSAGSWLGLLIIMRYGKV